MEAKDAAAGRYILRQSDVKHDCKRIVSSSSNNNNSSSDIQNVDKIKATTKCKQATKKPNKSECLAKQLKVLALKSLATAHKVATYKKEKQNERNPQKAVK